MDILKKRDPSTGGFLGRCAECGLPLPLRLPQAGEDGLDWVCTGCGASCRGVLMEDWPPEYLRNVRRAEVPPNQSEVWDAPNAQTDFVAPPDALEPQGTSSAALPDRHQIHSPLRNALSDRLDTAIDDGTEMRVTPQSEPFVDVMRQHGAVPYEGQRMTRFISEHQQSVEELDGLFISLAAAQSTGLDTAERISQEGLVKAAEDRDLFASLGVNSRWGVYPCQHSLSVGTLAMCVGATLRLGKQTLIELGIGCLVHDVGMLSVKRELHRNKRILGALDFLESRRMNCLKWE